jgi:hypothetical protein
MRISVARADGYGRRPPAATAAVVLVATLLAAMLFAGAASATAMADAGVAARLGRPAPLKPAGTIIDVRPTFRWSRVSGAARYEVRVYLGNALLVKKTGIKGTSCRFGLAMPTDFLLSWKVRASGASGTGGWSGSVKFMVVEPQIVPALVASWGYSTSIDVQSLVLRSDGTFAEGWVADGFLISGVYTCSGYYTADATQILFFNQRETWVPAADDPSHTAPYEDRPAADELFTYTLEDGGDTLILVDKDGISSTYYKN